MKTKDRILETAVALFNQNSVGEISVNQIAKEIGISPGNLRYHFKTKEEIVRKIWDCLIVHLDEIWADPEIHFRESAIAQWLFNLGNLYYRFRFMFLELPYILNRDPDLRQAYRKRTERMQKFLHVLLDAWNHAGILKKLQSDRQKEYLVRNLWLANQLWMYYWDTLHAGVTGDNIRDGSMQILYVYRPYLTKKSAEKIEQCLEKLCE